TILSASFSAEDSHLEMIRYPITIVEKSSIETDTIVMILFIEMLFFLRLICLTLIIVIVD
ncbi:MAG: hypothetical protein KDK21_00725, partial [Mesotoga sp.]|nr:hypothetical protein [Mesotoga sp.]